MVSYTKDNIKKHVYFSEMFSDLRGLGTDVPFAVPLCKPPDILELAVVGQGIKCNTYGMFGLFVMCNNPVMDCPFVSFLILKLYSNLSIKDLNIVRCYVSESFQVINVEGLQLYVGVVGGR